MKSVIQINGLILLILAVEMLLPVIIDPSDAKPFLYSAAITGYCGGTLYFMTRSTPFDMGLKEAFLLTATTWIGTSIFGGLPFMFSGYSAADSVFETVSGITTTGSTVVSGLDSKPAAFLFWRSWLQLIGGVGMIVTSIALLPFLNVGGMQLFRTESSDKSEKELPRAASVAAATLWVYAGLTALCTLCYFAAGMTFFDAVNHAFTTLSTGGYSTHDASMGFFNSPTILWIGTIFMIAGGIPFVLYIHILRHGRMDFRGSQLSFFLQFLTISTVIMALWLVNDNQLGVFDAFTHVAFNIASVVTTTGFVSLDYTLWGHFTNYGFIILTFAGACTGSTAGGIKMMRIMVASKLLRLQVKKIFYPHGIFIERYEGKPLTDDVFSSVCIFIFIYFVSLVVLTVALQAIGLDFNTAFSGTLTALSNVGPGIGKIIGPAGNFSTLPDTAKWLLSLAMLLGRLEFMTLLVLLLPSFWRKF